MNDGGKGDKRRKGANDIAYADGWERIFGKKRNPLDNRYDDVTETTKELNNTQNEDVKSED